MNKFPTKKLFLAKINDTDNNKVFAIGHKRKNVFPPIIFGVLRQHEDIGRGEKLKKFKFLRYIKKPMGFTTSFDKFYYSVFRYMEKKSFPTDSFNINSKWLLLKKRKKE